MSEPLVTLDSEDSGLSESSRIVPTNSSRHVAAVLRRMIVGEELPDGVTLPRQEDLLVQFGVSNPSLREALSMLEAEGLVTVQGGNRGGAIVHSPDSTAAALTIGLVLERRRTSLRDVGEAMARVQYECGEMCALAPDRVRRIMPVLKRLNERAIELIDAPSDSFVDSSLAFHIAIVELSDNQSLILINSALKVLSDSHTARVESSPEIERFTRNDRMADIRAHEAVASAIEEGDAPRVRQLLKAHIGAAIDFWNHIEGPKLVDVTSDGLEALREAAKPAPETAET